MSTVSVASLGNHFGTHRAPELAISEHKHSHAILNVHFSFSARISGDAITRVQIVPIIIIQRLRVLLFGGDGYVGIAPAYL
ncbi:MAG TPA: hypothetical protein VJ784_00050 [Pyrinomonadaceae bacterium]|nr:hypothetical protein [Pyrinomonadaceae bacterium]